MYEDFEIEIHCPHCDAEQEVRLSQIAREEKVPCYRCKQIIELKPDPKPGAAEMQKVDDSFDIIKQAIGRLKSKPDTRAEE
jgi:predicted Zn finger-like uncharacterized protein